MNIMNIPVYRGLDLSSSITNWRSLLQLAQVKVPNLLLLVPSCSSSDTWHHCSVIKCKARHSTTVILLAIEVHLTLLYQPNYRCMCQGHYRISKGAAAYLARLSYKSARGGIVNLILLIQSCKSDDIMGILHTILVIPRKNFH